MAMSDCSKCWDTPCLCGHGYKYMPLDRLEKLRNVVNRVWEERTSVMENTQKTVVEFEAALAKFLADCNAMLAEHYRTKFPATFATGKYDQLVAMESGIKYVRVVSTDGIGRSAWCFVERATGNVLKPDGWKRPAKGVRGSIYADTFAGYGVGAYGANYKR